MYKLKFVNGSEQEYSSNFITEEYFNGSSRATFTFNIERDKVNLEQLDALCTEENLAKLVIHNYNNDAEGIYDGYVLKLGLGVKQRLANKDTNEYEEYVELKLGKRTYIEQKLHELGVM